MRRPHSERRHVPSFSDFVSPPVPCCLVFCSQTFAVELTGRLMAHPVLCVAARSHGEPPSVFMDLHLLICALWAPPIPSSPFLLGFGSPGGTTPVVGPLSPMSFRSSSLFVLLVGLSFLKTALASVPQCWSRYAGRSPSHWVYMVWSEYFSSGTVGCLCGGLVFSFWFFFVC